MTKKILVFREFDDFSAILAENGFKVINLPLITTKSFEDLGEFEAKLAAIEIYDGVFITSAKAAGIFRAKLIEKKGSYGGRIYVLGRRSYEILRNLNLNLCFDESANTAREMLEKIAPEDLKSKRFLFVRGEKSLRVVPDFLVKTAAVDETIVYRTENVPVEIKTVKTIRAKIQEGEITAACFFSPSAAASFIEQFGAEILHQTIIATIGRTTAEYFETQNLKVEFVSPKATTKAFAESLSEHLKNMSLTMGKLAAKLEAEGYNENFYCIGSGWKRLSDGHALTAAAGGFEFFYTERGQENLIRFFVDEDEACNFVYEFLTNYKWAKSHLVGFFVFEKDAENLAAKLRAEKIESTVDKIPYGGMNDPRYRVFVFGTDFHKAETLKLEKIKLF